MLVKLLPFAEEGDDPSKTFVPFQLCLVGQENPDARILCGMSFSQPVRADIAYAFALNKKDGGIAETAEEICPWSLNLLSEIYQRGVLVTFLNGCKVELSLILDKDSLDYWYDIDKYPILDALKAEND